MDSKEILQQIQLLEKNEYWESILKKLTLDRIPFGIHLAIFIEPYLQYILEGKKILESRFSVNRIAPFQKIYQGDIILLKQSSSAIKGLCQINQFWYYRLNPTLLQNIKTEYSKSLCIDENSNFWEEKKDKTFLTLIQIIKPIKINPFFISKTDRRGWVVLLQKQKTLFTHKYKTFK